MIPTMPRFTFSAGSRAVPVQGPLLCQVEQELPGTRLVVTLPASNSRLPSNRRFSIRVRPAVRVFGYVIGSFATGQFLNGQALTGYLQVDCGVPVGSRPV